MDCVRSLGLAAFTERYQKWCKRHGYNFQPEKPAQIYSFSKELISVFTKDPVTKFLVKQAVEQLNTVSFTVEQLRLEMNRLAAQLPEYQVVMAMKGVGPSLGPQLMAEICDLSRFSHREALTAFAGVDPGVNQSAPMRHVVSVHPSEDHRSCARRCLSLSGQETFRREAVLCLHDCRCQ